MILANLPTSTGITQVTPLVQLLVDRQSLYGSAMFFAPMDAGLFVVDTVVGEPYDKYTFVLAVVVVPPRLSLFRVLDGCDA